MNKNHLPIDIVFFPSGEIKKVSSNMMNHLIQREYNIESLNMKYNSTKEILLDIKWDNELDEWLINDTKLKLFMTLIKNKKL